jgi:CBS-domain-containing membrane protein
MLLAIISGSIERGSTIACAEWNRSRKFIPLNSTAADIMTSPAVTIGQSAKLQEAALTMLDRNLGCLPVVDDGGNYVGIVTDDSFFPQQKRVPFAREKLTWVLGAWVSNLENLDDTLARLASHPVAEGMMQRNSVTAVCRPCRYSWHPPPGHIQVAAS